MTERCPSRRLPRHAGTGPKSRPSAPDVGGPDDPQAPIKIDDDRSRHTDNDASSAVDQDDGGAPW